MTRGTLKFQDSGPTVTDHFPTTSKIESRQRRGQIMSVFTSMWITTVLFIHTSGKNYKPQHYR